MTDALDAMPGQPLAAPEVRTPLSVPILPRLPEPPPPAFESRCRRLIQRPRLDLPQTSYPASVMAQRYGYPVVPTSKESVAIISLGGGESLADVQMYCRQYGFPVPPITVVSVDGATNDYSGDPNSADGENALDIQNVIGATGGKVGIIVYHALNTEASFAKGIRQSGVDNHACAGSCSWGSIASGSSPAARQVMDAAGQFCLGKGIPWFAASGDAGSGDGGAGNNVDFPASSPFFIGCGATTVTGTGERAWTYGGGGYSATYPKPPFQAVVSGSFRGVPDVAANGDPNTGYPVVVGGKWYTFGGTSAVGPMWAAATALIVTKTGRRQPDLVQKIYGSNLLTDITAGTNGAWNARPGWDECTGEGVPNKAFFDFMLAPAPSPPPPAPPPPSPPPPPAVGTVAVLVGYDSQGNVVARYGPLP